MHELAIAQQVIEKALALLPAHTTHVATLSLQLGALAGVSEDELRFGLEVMSKATPFEQTHVEITHLPAIAHCPQCGIDFAPEEGDLLYCPSCNTPSVIIVQGKELLITAVETVADEVAMQEKGTNG